MYDGVRFLVGAPMKRCTRCGVESNDFARNRTKSDGLQNVCRVCTKTYNRQRYIEDPQRQLAANRVTKERNRQRFIDYKQTLSCTDCGNVDWRVLEFDHLSDKIGNVSELAIHWSWERLMTEIEKCEVVCANCHRIRTHERKTVPH